MNSPDQDSTDAIRIELEDSLKYLLACDELGRGVTVESLAGSLTRSRPEAAEILGRLRSRGLASAKADEHYLTEDGRIYALRIVRTHRLYETWLARETSTPPSEWHREAHKAEHHIGASETEELAKKLNYPRFDPHGDAIPTLDGHLPKRVLHSLAEWPNGKPARIEHIEDEPESLFRAAQALGLAPGTQLDECLTLDNGSIEAIVENRRIIIPATIAPLIDVVELLPSEKAPDTLSRLSALPIGSEAIVQSITAFCSGPERRRLLDLGVVPGTRIRCEFASPFGSPRSYDIRGALIALRNSQADLILVHSAAPTRS